MRLIVPMAGRGTRLRPHTHVTPKPLLPVVGRTMVERIVETFAGVLPRGFDEAVFILGPDFGEDVRAGLSDISTRHGFPAHFAVQDRALGTGHAVLQAAPWLDGECVIVFADTLFAMEAEPDLDADAVIWVKTVDDPRRFGVVVKEAGRINAFVEKPQEPISNEAIIGIYYVRDGATLRTALQSLVDENVTGVGGEYQLTDALDAMLKRGLVFKTASVTEWLDCGTVPALMETTEHVLDLPGEARKEGSVENTTVVEPVFIGPGARVQDAVIGPYAAIHGGAVVRNSVLRHTIVFDGATVEGSALDGSLVGQHAVVKDFSGTLNVGDHATVG
jgi:glucose-1-phosphate thymidylyltransferase